MGKGIEDTLYIPESASLSLAKPISVSSMGMDRIARNELTIYLPESLRVIVISLQYSLVSAGNTGFPSPSDDFIEDHLDLHDYLNIRPSSTFYARARGISMIEAGIDPKDILVVDRSLDIRNGDRAHEHSIIRKTAPYLNKCSMI